MRFGYCNECNEYKFLNKNTGSCPTCEEENLSTLEKLERAAIDMDRK